MLDAYLRELERELARRLPREAIQSRLMEVAAHANETTEAFREMGLSEDAAVRAMGCPRRLARGLAQAALGAWDRRRVRFAACAMAGFGANLAGLPPWPLLIQPLAIFAIAASFGGAYGAYRARRPRPLALLAIAFALVGPMTVQSTLRWVHHPFPNGVWANSPRSGIVRRQPDPAFDAGAAEPLLVQGCRQVPGAIGSAAYLATVVGGGDLGFAALGLVVFGVRRRRGVA